MLLSAWKGMNLGSLKHTTHPLDSPSFCGLSRKGTAIPHCRAVNYEVIQLRTRDTSTPQERTLHSSLLTITVSTRCWRITGETSLTSLLLPWVPSHWPLHATIFLLDLLDRLSPTLMVLDLRVTSNYPQTDSLLSEPESTRPTFCPTWQGRGSLSHNHIQIKHSHLWLIRNGSWYASWYSYWSLGLLEKFSCRGYHIICHGEDLGSIVGWRFFSPRYVSSHIVRIWDNPPFDI